jgi:hypothetical protein
MGIVYLIVKRAQGYATPGEALCFGAGTTAASNLHSQAKKS